MSFHLSVRNSNDVSFSCRTTDLATRVAGICVQLHGGWGYMWEFPIARAFAATKVYPIYTGSNEIMKELIARDICSDRQ